MPSDPSTKQQPAETPPMLGVVAEFPYHDPKWVYTFKNGYFRDVPWIDSTIDTPESFHVDALHSLSRFLEQSKHDPQMLAYMREFALTKAMPLIFFSNQIEDSGLAQSETYILLQRVLGGTPPSSPRVMSPRSTKKLYGHVEYGRREVMQHAEAYRFLCIQNVQKPLTIDLIQQTHAILMKDMTLSNGKTVQAGVFRKSPVYAGFHTFIPSVLVPHAMNKLVRTFLNESQSNHDWEAAEQEEFRDPYSLAAQLCHDFVCIHPFEDGNGRMCRLLLNYALMHYGLPFPIALLFGVHQQAKSKYLYCVRKDSRSTDGVARWTATSVIESVAHSWGNFFENYRLAYGKDEPRFRHTKQ